MNATTYSSNPTPYGLWISVAVGRLHRGVASVCQLALSLCPEDHCPPSSLVWRADVAATGSGSNTNILRHKSAAVLRRPCNEEPVCPFRPVVRDPIGVCRRSLCSFNGKRMRQGRTSILIRIEVMSPVSSTSLTAPLSSRTLPLRPAYAPVMT